MKAREENVLLRGTSGVAWCQLPDLRVGQERGSSKIRDNHCLLHVRERTGSGAGRGGSEGS